MAPSNGISERAVAQATAGAGGGSGSETKDLWSRYEYARYGDNMKNELIEDLITRYDSLFRKHAKYVEAHPEDGVAAPGAMNVARELQNSVNYLQDLLNRNPFVIVLIDGEGMIFHQNYLQQGAAGGQAAASHLKKAVHSWARDTYPTEVPKDTKIIIRVYANVKALTETCGNAGIVDRLSRIDEFVRAFNSADDCCDFIDVGDRQNAARDKVVESFKLYLHNFHCRHILFGGSHDDTYSAAIQPFMGDQQSRSRMSLLEGIPFGPDQKALPVPKVRLPAIFRDTKLILPPSLESRLGADPRSRVGSGVSLNGASTIFTPRTNTPLNLSSPFGSVTSLDQHSMMRVESQDAPTISYAAVTGRNAHLPLKNEVEEQHPFVPKGIKRNKHYQRIDAKMDYDRKEVQRVKQLKACNQHYIGIGCCHYNAGRADKCPHRHDYDFSAAELKTLRVVARETPCKKGTGCDDPKCIYGHQCPFPVAVEGSMRGSGQCLNGENCRFPAEMHGVDQNPIRVTKVTGL